MKKTVFVLMMALTCNTANALGYNWKEDLPFTIGFDVSQPINEDGYASEWGKYISEYQEPWLKKYADDEHSHEVGITMSNMVSESPGCISALMTTNPNYVKVWRVEYTGKWRKVRRMAIPLTTFKFTGQDDTSRRSRYKKLPVIINNCQIPKGHAGIHIP